MKSKGKLSRWSRTPMERRRSLWGWGFISLWFIGTVAFFVVPMLQTAVYAFSKVTLTSSGVNYQYVGLKNFLYVFTEDADFLPNLTESLGTMLYRVPIIVIFSLLMAMLLRNKFRGKTFFRSVFFFPVIIASGVVITILQTQVMMTGSATTAGQESYMFSAPDFLVLTETLGVPQAVSDLISSVVNGFFDITWKSGVQTVLLLSAVSHISPSSYEAADMEGATAWEKLWKITFPMISPTILVVLVYTIVDTFTDYSNKVMRMISGFFGEGQYEYSTTVGLAYFVIVLVIIGVVSGVFSRWIYYANNDK